LNIYLVVEGPVGEKQVYSHWVPLVNPKLSVVKTINDVKKDNIIIYSGGGYPSYFEVIEAGIEDVASTPHLDRLVIAIDSEEMTYDDKRKEIEDFISDTGTTIDYKIIIQHFCLETWALGNKKIVSRKPKDKKLQEYNQHFNVLVNDPELLPDYPQDGLNRAQFAEHYLRKLLNEKHRNLTYTKSNPSALLHDKYYDNVKNRLNNDGHNKSFNDFLLAFI